MHYSGAVQGVGFRYTACLAANGHDVTGFVRNLPDGQVQCVVEGETAEVDAFLAEVASRMGHHIRRVDQQAAPHTGRFGNFGVRA